MKRSIQLTTAFALLAPLTVSRPVPTGVAGPAAFLKDTKPEMMKR